MKRTLLFLLALITVTVALAADVMPPVPDLNLEEWARDSAAFAAVIAFAVYIVRTYLWKALDGDRVKAFSVILGAAGGAALGLFTQFFDGNVISGLVHGVTAGVLSFVGVDGVRSIAKTGRHAEPLALVSGQDSSAGAWIVEQARGLVPQNKLTAALDLLSPLIAKFAGSALTDELRSDLQAQIHKTLKAARLIPERDFGRKS